MSKNMKKTEAILREMVMITLRSELTKIQRTNLETCITIHMHQKESTGESTDVQTLCYWASQMTLSDDIATMLTSVMSACSACQVLPHMTVSA